MEGEVYSGKGADLAKCIGICGIDIFNDHQVGCKGSEVGCKASKLGGKCLGSDPCACDHCACGLTAIGSVFRPGIGVGSRLEGKEHAMILVSGDAGVVSGLEGRHFVRMGYEDMLPVIIWRQRVISGCR